MDVSKYKGYLMKFSVEELKQYLGQNLVDMLIEWSVEPEPLFTKSRLADMIVTIYGINRLSDKEFRRSFLSRLAEDDLLSFREFLPSKFKASPANELIPEIIKASWARNAISQRLLEILDIAEDVFPYAGAEEQTIDTITAPDRFYELFDYQYVIKQQVLNHLTSGSSLNKMLVHMPTGTGKTKTAMHTIVHHFIFNMRKRGLVIWMAHTTELLQQALETFTNVWRHIGDGDANTYKLWGSFELEDISESLDGFMFCGFVKLMSIAKSKPETFSRLVNDCRLLVIDEAHKAAAPETKKIISDIMVKKSEMRDRALIGLTATPGRNAANAVDIGRLVTMFDGKLIDVNTDTLNRINFTEFKVQNTLPERDTIKFFQERQILARLRRERLSYSEGLNEVELQKLKGTAVSNGYDDKDFSRVFLETVGRNRNRNIAIMNKLIQLNREQIPAIVFACSVEHGKILSAALILEGIDNACVFGDMNPLARATAIRRFKDRGDGLNVLINYEVLTTGFDATNIKCVFITRPTQSIVLYSQMIGRGLRGPMMGGNTECLLVDIEDNLSKYNESMAYNYFSNYWTN